MDTCLNDVQRDAKTVALMAPAIKREDVHKQTTIIFTTLQTVAVLRVAHQDTIVLIEFSFGTALWRLVLLKEHRYIYALNILMLFCFCIL